MGQIKLRKRFNTILHEQYRQGYGKPKNKNEHNSTPYIHSENTYKTYKAQCSHFVEFCYANNVKYDMQEAAKLIPEYGRKMESEGKSDWTIHTAISAIAKAYNVSTESFGYKAPKRERASVKRSRYATEMDKHFSVTANQNLVTFNQCFGLRRRELEALTGNCIAYNKSGQLFVKVINGKGGKSRYAMFCGTEKEKQLCLDLMNQASITKVFSHVHTKADLHYYRSVYACKLYKRFARPISDIPKEDKYICRKDKAGIVYDKKAMVLVSKNLGHNRISVIANSYLHNL